MHEKANGFEWNPTHRIVVRDSISGRVLLREEVSCPEALRGDSGPAYTREEWDSTAQADWEYTTGEGWTFQGSASPYGSTIVDVSEVCS